MAGQCFSYYIYGCPAIVRTNIGSLGTEDTVFTSFQSLHCWHHVECKCTDLVKSYSSKSVLRARGRRNCDDGYDPVLDYTHESALWKCPLRGTGSVLLTDVVGLEKRGYYQSLNYVVYGLGSA